MTLAELVEEKTEALRVRDVARILDVSVKQIYKIAANGQIPSLRIANTVRFDPQEFAFWLRTKSSMGGNEPNLVSSDDSSEYETPTSTSNSSLEIPCTWDFARLLQREFDRVLKSLLA
jgi:excisionase family DNA binding protein